MKPYLLKSIYNPQYIEEYIKRRDEVKFDNNDIVDLLKSTHNMRVIDKYIKRRINYNFSKCNILELIIATNNTKYIERCIENRVEYGFVYKDIIELICSTHSSEMVEKYIQRVEEFKFNTYELIELIVSTNDSKYIDSCIKRSEKFGLNIYEIKQLICEIKDPKYLDDYIKNSEEFGLKTNEVVTMIKSTYDSKYIDKYIKKRKEYGFSKQEIMYLIEGVKDHRYLIQYIENRDELELKKKEVKEILKRIKDSKYINECIERKEEFGWDDKDIIILSLYAGNEEFISKLDEYNGPMVNLPENMTIGIEIENVGNASNDLFKIGLIKGWECKEDSTIKTITNEEGIEIVSPILTGDNKESTKQIGEICTVLKKLGQYANESCGGHIHIGADYLTNIQSWCNLIELWSNTEKILYIVSNKEGWLPRIRVSYYASPISKDLEEQINDGSINLEDENNLDNFKKKLMISQTDRRRGINFRNLVKGGKQTIEFRLSNGTEDAKTWIENINLFGGLVKAAEELFIIQQKDELERTKEEQEKLDCFENIRNKRYDEKETFEQLLQIVVSEENRECYRQRYKVNSEKLKSNQELERELKAKATNNSIKIHKKNIGKSVVKGEDRITREEFQITNEIIFRDVDKENENIERE